MKFCSRITVLFVVLSFGSVFGTEDPFLMFGDSGIPIYTSFRFCDTAREMDFNCAYGTDTGDGYAGDMPNYINFDYQFSSDSFKVVDPYDTTFVLYSDLRPGYAGFKTAWDMGMTGFPVSRYKYIVLAHKGLPATHKVTVRFWYNDGGCGHPSYNELIGTLASSDTWKVDTLAIPESVQNKPDRQRNFNKYYEMVFIINNLDPNDTTSGPPANFKVDNIRLAGCNPVDSTTTNNSSTTNPPEVKAGESVTFRVWTSRADSADVLTFQWKKDGVEIAGATDSVYTLASAKTGDAGVYTAAVAVSSTGLTFSSQGSTLKVKEEGCGCGSGTGAALIPPLIFKAMAHRRKKNAKSGRKA